MSDSYTSRFTEVHKLLGHIDAGSHAGGVSTAWASMRDYHRGVALVLCGTLAGTLDVAIWQATDAAGTSAKLVTGKTITQLNGAGDSDSHCAIEIRTEELDVDGGFDYIRVQTVNSVANIYGIYLFGIVGRFNPVGTTEWDEVVD